MKNPLYYALASTVLIIAGVAVFSSQADKPQALQTAAANAAQPAGEIHWQRYDEGLKLAQNNQKMVLVEFFASWCGYCKKMDLETFADPKVQQVMDRYFVPVRVTESSEEKVAYQGQQVTEKELTAKHGVSGFPTLVFMQTDGEIITTIPGYQPPEEFGQILEFIGSESYKRMDYKAFAANQKKS